jgi:hypothetical protein
MNTIWPVNPICTPGGPPTYQFEQSNNADWIQQITLNSYNPNTNQRIPFDLEGVEVKMELVGLSSGDPSLLLSTGNSMLLVPSSGDLGELIIQVPAAEMWTLPAGDYNGDCLLFMPNGSIINAFTVQLTINAGYTAPYP